MKTKRFILMLLLALMSVTGAWATDTGTDNLSAMCLETQNIKVTPAGVLDLTHIHEVVIWVGYSTTKIEAKNGVKIKEIVLQGCSDRTDISYGVSASGASEIIEDAPGVYTINFTNGVTSTIIGPGNNVHPGNAGLDAMAINVTYEYPDHTHSYAGSWTHDDECHWHECTSLIGLCKDKQGSKAPHNYGDSGEAYYTCQTCGYVNEARKAQYLDRDYLSLTATGGDMTIGMQKTGSPNDYVIRYSADKMQWTTQTLSATTEIVTIPAGKTYYFAHGTDDVLSRISNRQDNCWSFTMTGSGTVQAGGNIVSLLDVTCQKNTLAGSPQHVFTGLFKGCEKLTKAPELPFNSLSQFCYMYMFEGTGISVAPELPATTIPDGAYMGMFRNCRNLMTVSPLPATSLARRAYDSMFYGCENLTSVEIANITSMEQRTDASNACFTNWLEGAAAGATGVVNMPDALVGNELIFLPNNWTAHSIDGHNYVPEKDADDHDNWVWEGVTKATLMFVCTKNANHKQEMVATGGAITNAITTQPTCTTDGVRTYTATVTVDGVKFKGTKEVVEPKFGHSYQYGVCTRCGDSPSHFDEFTINDGDPYLLPHSCTAGTLTYSRYYPVNVWSAWLTPFDVNASYLKDNGLTPAYIEGIHNYDDNEDGTIDRTVMEIVKISNGRILAGTPLLVRAAEGYSSQLELSDVAMKANDELNNIHTETASTKYDFIGTYTGTTAAAGDNIYSLNTSTGALVHRTGKILPLRWYCQIEQKPSFIGEETSPALARSIYIRVIGEEDQVTGIRTLYNEADQTLEQADGIFDISGRKLSVPQRGKVNIINGKKQFVR